MKVIHSILFGACIFLFAFSAQTPALGAPQQLTPIPLDFVPDDKLGPAGCAALRSQLSGLERTITILRGKITAIEN